MWWIFRTVRADANSLFERLAKDELPFDIAHTHSAGGYLFQRHNIGSARRIPVTMSLYGTAIDEIVTLARLLKDAHAEHGLRTDLKRVFAIIYFAVGLVVTRRTFTRGSDALSVTSKQQKRLAVKYYKFRPEQVHIVPNGVRTTSSCRRQDIRHQPGGCLRSPDFSNKREFRSLSEPCRRFRWCSRRRPWTS